MTAPGVPPVTLREVQAANRALVSAMRRRSAAKKALTKAERAVSEARARVRTLLELAQNAEKPEKVIRCRECEAPIGSSPQCPECQAVQILTTPLFTDKEARP